MQNKNFWMQLLEFVRAEKKWWLLPLIILLLLTSVLIVVAYSSPVSQFIYALF